MRGKKVLLTALMLAYLAGSPNHKNTSLSTLWADGMPPDDDRPVAELVVNSADSGYNLEGRVEDVLEDVSVEDAPEDVSVEDAPEDAPVEE